MALEAILALVTLLLVQSHLLLVVAVIAVFWARGW